MFRRAFWSKKWVRVCGYGCVLVLALLIGACLFFRISRPQDLLAYTGMYYECHPIWRQFALRRYGAGDSVQELLRRYPPTYREEFGRYGIYIYEQGEKGYLCFTGIRVETRDGRLLSVLSYSDTWMFTFFETPDPSFETEYHAYLRGRSASNPTPVIEP